MKHFLSRLYIIPTLVMISATKVLAVQGPTGGDDMTLDNPLGNVTTIGDFIGKIIDIVLYVAVPLLVVVFVWLGFQFVLAQGNASELEKVKRNLWYTLIGAAIVLGASAINGLLTSTFEGLGR